MGSGQNSNHIFVKRGIRSWRVGEYQEYLERALEMAKHQDQDQDQDYMYQDQDQDWDRDTGTMASGQNSNHILVKRGIRPWRVGEYQEYQERALEMAKHQDQDYMYQDYMYQDQDQDQDQDQ